MYKIIFFWVNPLVVYCISIILHLFNIVNLFYWIEVGDYEQQSVKTCKRGSPQLRKTLFLIMDTILKLAPIDGSMISSWWKTFPRQKLLFLCRLPGGFGTLTLKKRAPQGAHKKPLRLQISRVSLEAQTGFEPVRTGVADHCLTAWLMRHIQFWWLQRESNPCYRRERAISFPFFHGASYLKLPK